MSREKDSPAVGRVRRSSQRRLVRTIVLGTVAVAVAIAWMAREWGMDSEELLGYATTSLMLVGGMVVLALLTAALIRGIKALGRRR